MMLPKGTEVAKVCVNENFVLVSNTPESARELVTNWLQNPSQNDWDALAKTIGMILI